MASMPAILVFFLWLMVWRCALSSEDKTSTVYLEEGNTTTICSPGFPGNYPTNQYEEWNFYFANGFLLNFSHFSLESDFDFVFIHNGLNKNDRDVEQTLSGTFNTSMVYLYYRPYLRLIFISDDRVEDSGFCVDILATNATSLVHCAGSLIPVSEMCSSDVFCENKFDGEHCLIHLEDGDIEHITTPKFPNSYPPNHRKEWKLLSTTGFVLNFTNFSLEHNYDFLSIHNGKNTTVIETRKQLTGEFTNKAYVFDGPYLHLIFTSDELIQLSGFRVEILATNISSLVHCDGLVVPTFEMCNFHVFCDNALDEENCQIEEGDIEVITSPRFPENYLPNQEILWRLWSTTGYVLNFTDFKLGLYSDFLRIRNGKNITEINTTETLSTEFHTSISYVFAGPFLELLFFSDWIYQSSGFRIEVFAVNVTSLVYLEEGKIFRITSPNFPNDYPRKQKVAWRLLSKAGYVLNFTNFSLQYNHDFLYIHNGENATLIDSRKKISGSFDTSFAYVFSGPFLNVTFVSDDYKVSSGFSVDIVATNTTTLVHCEGLLVPKYEMCNFHVFCANAIDEENCSGLLDVDQLVTVPSFKFPNVYHAGKGYIYNEWRLSSRSGYLLNISALNTTHLDIENFMGQNKSYYKNRLDGSWKNGVSYVFEMFLLKIRIRLFRNQLTDEVGFHDSPSNGKYFGRTVPEHDLSVVILTTNVTSFIDCSRLCPNQTFFGPAGEIKTPQDLKLTINFNCLCEWNITVSHNTSVSLNITSMQLPCDLVNLEIVTPATNTLPDRTSGICGNESGLILSEGNTLILRLRISTGDDGQVFRAVYRQSAIPGCGILPFNNVSHVRHHACTASSAFIASANYPLQYEAGLDWFWYITTSPSTYIEIVFQEFDIQSRTAKCEEDYLEFTLQSSSVRLCNETMSEKDVSYFSDDNKLTIKLNSNPYSHGGRFLAVYYERIFDRAVQVIALQGNVTCMNISQGGIQNCYCLFNHPHRISWLNASVFCQRCGTGGYLTTIQSQREMDFLQQIILRTGDPTQSAYIGLTWSDKEKRHIWSSGYPLSFTDWRVSE
ncbi:Cubilin [Holothuria leucospilota]|uniref:Cubilin n=1 Tax=Holothuria leucospilota TaxID=206669 RepID=A0A9Q0YSG8_HOLLE|nr:Cubilin [Holothuria leucospilota]